MSETKPPRVAVLGAGITGLAAAYELLRLSRERRRPLEVVVLESTGRVGGKVLTEVHDGVSMEAGPDSFLTPKPHALELVRELGLDGDLLRTHPTCKTVYALCGGRLEPFPDGSLVPPKLMAFLRSRLLSWPGKIRLALEPLIPRELGAEDESIGAFVRRRLGPQVSENILGPVLGGIYAGDSTS
jgi:oxygen-dependent protoporphyrinogen oxidase